jgi:uncharacterized zinc-type alcohol dehydrogenase-like protein
MTKNTTAWIANESGAKLVKGEWELPPLLDNHVEIRISHCGLCHTDEKMINNLWGVSRYPICPGHEGVGVVSAVGTHVQNLAVGDRVGIAWVRDSCGRCENCLRGQENICLNGYTCVMLGEYGGVKNNGAYSRDIRIHEKFATKIPDGISDLHAAPLLCAGSTVYNALRDNIHRPCQRVAIVGIGGLGHLAIQMARFMGANVTAISSSSDKRDYCHELGAHAFVNLNVPEEMEAVKASFELILYCSSSSSDWSQWFKLLQPGSNFCLVGIPKDEITIPVIPLVFGQWAITGSIVAGSHYLNEMMHFCDTHKIYPLVEEWDFERVNEAIQYVVENKARFRVVLKFNDE